MRIPRLLAILVLPLAILFTTAVGQDSTGTKEADPGMMARAKAIAQKRAEEKRLRQQMVSDSVVSGQNRVDDRGDWHGQGRDTGGAIILDRAGELRQIEDARGEEIVLLENNVKIIQDSMTTWCDWARHRRQQGLLELYGDVVMIDPERSLKADEVFYYENNRRSIARGNVILERDSVIMYCEQAQYDEVSDVATFDRNVIGRDLRRKIVITGDNGTYDTERQFARIPTDPILIQIDSLDQEEARVVGEYMEYDALNGLALARENVKITWHDVEGWGDELFFYPDSNLALLVGEPRILHIRDEVLGDSIWMYMREGTLDSAVVKGNAVAYTPSDSIETAPRSSLRGKRIVLTFTEGEISQMASYGQAVGIYHVFQDGVDQGSNQVSGDHVELNIEENNLQSVRVVGGTEGTFYPPHLAGKLRNERP
ncbi:hypothetical protein KQI52_12270 [bacterium]|nr:hypothetical protein [bacterium]